MKKFIKKTIAGLIAGVMAVSSMPFTALAALSVNDFTAREATAYGTFESDSDYNDEAHYKQIYKNVLYSPSKMGACYTSGAVSAEGKDKIYLTGKVYYGNTVLLYNGGTTPAMGVGFAVVGYSKPWNYGYGNVRAFRCNLSGDTQGITLRDSKWHGNDGRMNYTYIMFGQGETIGTTSDSQCVQGERGYYGNVLQYTGGDFTADYKKINLGFEYVVGTDEGSHQTHQTGTISSTSIYVLNYKKLVDKANAVKTELSGMDTSIYEETSLNNYYNAINNMFAFNPTSYNYLSDQEGTVKTAAQDMNRLMTAVDTAKSELKIKYTFVKNDGTSSVVAAVNETEALANKPVNTASTQKTYAGENKHKWTEYTWPATATNYTFTEKASDKSEACNVVDSKCTECGNVFLDLEAWDKASNEYVTITITDASKYTNESMDEYKALAKQAIDLRNSATTQEDVDKATAMLLSAQSVLRKKSVTVTLQKVGANDTPDTIKIYENQEYGKVLEIDLATVDSTIKGVDKWTVSTDNGATTTRLNTYDKKISIVVTKDVVIKAYQTDEEQTATSSKVTFYGKNNVVVAVKYVANGTPLKTNTVGVPKIPFYGEGKWDKETVTGTGSDISVKAVYETTEDEKDFCGVHYDGFEGGVKKYSYDSYVYLTGADTTKKYALYSDAEHTKLLTILNGIDFYAPKTNDIYVGVYEGKDEASIGITGSFSQRDDKKGTKSAVYNCKFYLPKDAKVVEYGLEVTLNGKTAKVKAESKSERNEYSISLNAPITSTSITEVYGRAYVTYTLDGETTTTAYSGTVKQAL
ncbi:hypothetical protein [uncultured Eubacterium sp.]|uniref:hypothetical protein n=1 Tax=uncultured Eubacterium sp. TaxID=165185 RepID=UPI00262C2A04|nr:hypothetical protein [uncultured Eubacterium sp.]